MQKKHFADIEIIRATIRVSNKISQKTALACGFKEQYTDRRHVIVNDNSFEDCIVYDLEGNNMKGYSHKDQKPYWH